MKFVTLPVALIVFTVLSTKSHGFHLDSYTDNLLQEVMSRMFNDERLTSDYDFSSLDDYPLLESSRHSSHSDKPSRKFDAANQQRLAKEYGSKAFKPRHENILDREPSIRDQEYLEHSSLFGHQFVQGGAGEGYQRLKPDGSMKNIEVLKTDGVLASYCNPPNPCPIDYTSEDGCLEDFVNTAVFSQEYQAAQECMCDTEHMFDCPGATRENEIDALARSIQNEGVVDSTLNRLVENMQIEGQHKSLVAKKFNAKKARNPYLEGDKLPVVAKKTPKA